MSFKPKIIVLSVAAFIAAAGGYYASMPGGAESDPDDRNNIKSLQRVAQADATGGPEAVSAPRAEDVKAVNASATVEQSPVVQGPVAIEAPKKLTRQQLTPPPASDEEKLQKSAEQESNF